MLYNENCLNIIDDIIKSNSNVIIVSDPPFNIKYHYNSYKDNMNKEQNANRKFIGIELEKEYYDIAYNRIKGSE